MWLSQRWCEGGFCGQCGYGYPQTDVVGIYEITFLITGSQISVVGFHVCRSWQEGKEGKGSKAISSFPACPLTTDWGAGISVS